VAAAVNNARSNSVSALNAQKTQCPQGHSLADAYRYSNGTRHCRPCGQKRAREHQRNLRAARRATQQTTTERTAA
jgi:ribosomal protein L37AE/L43A